MPTIFYVHILELVVGLLSVFLLVQLTRTYRLHAANDFASNVGVRNAMQDYSKLDDIPILVDVVDTHEIASRGAYANALDGSADAKASNSETILNDYIGGFFGEPVPPREVDIKAFRAVDSDEADKIISAHAMNEGAEIADIAPFRAREHNSSVEEIPLLNAKIPEELLTGKFLERKQSLDDTEIAVDGTKDQGSPTGGAKVMSDKVVLAMLDEAKVVSVN